jgi:hypothetical protein
MIPHTIGGKIIVAVILTVIGVMLLSCSRPISDAVIGTLRDEQKRVTVVLDIDLHPAAELSEKEIAEERTRLTEMQDAVIRDMEGVIFTDVRRYPVLGIGGLSALTNRAARDRLSEHPLVREVSKQDSGGRPAVVRFPCYVSPWTTILQRIVN